MARQIKPNDHLIIPDTQIKPGVEDLDFLTAAGNFAVDRQPGKVICLGDWYDMPALSSWDSKKSAEGKRILADIDSGNAAMHRFLAPIKAEQANHKYKKWEPRMVFLLGNHEQRIERFVNDHPQFDGFVGYEHLDLKDWEVKDFLEIVEIDGVYYSHYFCNPFTGKPLGGTATTRLKNLNFSFVMGHVQKLDFARIDLANGKVLNGVVAGSFYEHHEDYKKGGANNHWRGLIYLHGVKDGNFDLEVISIERLKKEWL